MKIGLRLNLGFLAVALLVLVVGYVSLNATNRIKKQSAISDASKTLFVNILGMEETLHAYLLSEDPAELSNINEKHRRYDEFSEMWLEALAQGSDSAEFRSKDAYKTWVKYGYEAKGVRVPSAPEVSGMVEEMKEIYEDMHKDCRPAMDLHSEQLKAKARFDEEYLKEREKRHGISDGTYKAKNPTLHRDLGNMVYKSKEALFEYRDKKHLDEWLESIRTLKTDIAAADEFAPEESSALSASIDEYLTIAQIMSELTLEIRQKESDKLAKLALIGENIAEIDEKIDELGLFVTTSVEETKTRATIILMGVAGFSIILASGIAFFTSRSISKPVNKFRDTAIEIAEGNLDTKVEITSNDEIGQLAGAFNEMTRKLKESYAGLEKQVRERTKELVNANEELKEEIIERKRVEETLRESEKRHRMLFEKAGDAIFIMEAEGAEAGKIVAANQAAAEMHGYKVDELMALNIRDLDMPDAAKEIPERIRRILEGEWIKEEITHRKKDGTVFPIEISAGLLEIGSHKYILAFDRDISEQKELEAQLRQAQKMEAIGTLAGGIAHDFNNILFPIIGYTEMTTTELAEDSVARSNLLAVLKAANRAKGLVQQILTFSRQSEQERKPLKIQPILKEALKLLRASLPSTIEITQNIDRESGAILADPTQIHQVIINLCTNAYHAMREKGGVLEVILTEVDADSTDLTFNPDLSPGPYLRLTISDTGHGMDRIVMERIFDPYFTTKGLGEGTGLGLAVVHGIVRSHGGDITVYSEPGKGTTFHVYLPRIDAGAIAPETVSTEPAPKGKERILLVDDEEQIVLMVRQMLEGLGYTVTARTSSVEALEAFRAKPEKFDLAITDQTMPNMTGAELAQKLMGIRADIPIILCTGFSEVITEDKSKGIGIREYVMKPVLRSEMAKTIRRVLDKK